LDKRCAGARRNLSVKKVLSKGGGSRGSNRKEGKGPRGAASAARDCRYMKDGKRHHWTHYKGGRCQVQEVMKKKGEGIVLITWESGVSCFWPCGEEGDERIRDTEEGEVVNAITQTDLGRIFERTDGGGKLTIWGKGGNQA